MKKTVILTEQEIADTLLAMAKEIAERSDVPENLVLVGIRTGGAYLAARLQRALASLHMPKHPLGVLDITLYRDDWTRLGPTPMVGKTELPFSLEGKVVVLVDDVLFTGRTVRAAMDALIDYGRPERIELAILVDRGDRNRELPIRADYTGLVLDTGPGETINVYLKEGGSYDHVAVEERRAA